MGGAFAQNVSWRWIFWINLPIIGTGTIAIIVFLKLEKLPGHIVDKIKAFDWIGSVVFVGSTVGFLIPLTWGGVQYPWDSWRTLFPLLFGAAGLVGFGFYEYYLFRKAEASQDRNPIDPIIRFTIFNNATMLITYFETVIHGIVLWGLLYFLPLYYEAVKGYTPIISGVAILPETSLVAPMAVVVGVVSSLTGRYRWGIWVGWLLTTLGSGLLILLGPDTTIAEWVFLNVAVSVGTGMLFPAMALAIQAAGRSKDAGHAAAFYSFLRVFGQSIGVAISGVIFQNQIKQKLLSYELLAPLADQYSKDATALVGVIKGMADGIEKTQLIKAYADSLDTVWIVMTALSAVAFFASLWTKGYSLTQEHNTKQGFHEEKSSDPESGSTTSGAA
jgi:MFS family permease